MPLKKLLAETSRLGELISTALANDLRRNKRSRHASYKAKRIAEATEMWDNYNKKLKEIKAAAPDANDPCITSMENKYAEVYKQYTERLLAIVTEEKEESDSESDELKMVIKAQWNRLLKINLLISDVLTKRDNNEVPVPAYITIKLQRILDFWKKIEDDDDMIDQERDQAYTREVAKMENLMEEAVMFLREHTPSTSSSTKNDGLKLNRVEIQKFDGDYFKWTTFRDLFDSLVIQNNNLPKAQKMQMLKTHVTGEAETLLNDLVISEANFDSAWDRLMHRYNNNRVIIYKLLTKLINQGPCKGDAKSLKALLDTTDQIIMALQNMNRPTAHWDDWIIVILTQKLNAVSHKDWEQSIAATNALPTWPQLKEFLEEQFRMHERLESKHPEKIENKQLKAFQGSIEGACIACNGAHTLFHCQQWRKMTPTDRLGVVKRRKWCKKCLRDCNDRQKCDKTCKKCKKNHSTWLHEKRVDKGDKKEPAGQLNVSHGTLETGQYDVLLATAVIKTYNFHGQPIMLRALIDSGAEGSLITERAAALINAKTTLSNRWLNGLTGARSDPLKKIHITIEPRFTSNFFLDLDFYILKSLAKTLPRQDMDPSTWKHIQKLVWADPHFHNSGPIDALLGMDAIVEIMQPGIIKGLSGQPMAQETHLGWIMSGKIKLNSSFNDMKCFLARITDVNQDLSKFWEIEDMHPERALTTDEIECENLFQSTVSIANNGQFSVEIPFKQGKEGPSCLGESKGQAIARFLQVLEIQA